MQDNNINFVGWGRTQGKINYPWVDLDNEGSVDLIMHYLFEKNHRKIAFINVNEKYKFAFQRNARIYKIFKTKKNIAKKIRIIMLL